MALATLKGAEALDNCDFRPTAQQPLGPFYPKRFPIDTDEFCRPVAGAIVEIWQACHTGKYNHPSDTWRRPPHMHYKVSLRGYRELVSQLYFAGDVLNQHDLILQDLHVEDQKQVVVKFDRVALNGEVVLKGKFDLTIKKA